MRYFKDIKGYEGYFSISENGVVFDIIKNSIKRSHNDIYGYPIVSLKGKLYKVHRLVAIAFIPNPDQYPNVLHKDDNPSNPSVDNLFWGTQKHNVHDCISKGRRKSNPNGVAAMAKPDIVIKRGKALRKPVLQFDKGMNFIQEWDGAITAGKTLGLSKDNIGGVCLGRNKTCGGFIWRFK